MTVWSEDKAQAKLVFVREDGEVQTLYYLDTNDASFIYRTMIAPRTVFKAMWVRVDDEWFLETAVSNIGGII